MVKNKEFMQGDRLGKGLVGFVFGAIVSTIKGVVQLVRLTNGTFAYYLSRQTGELPKWYEYVLLWMLVILVPILFILLLKLILPDPILELLDTVLGIVFTFVVAIAVILAAVNGSRK